MHIARLSGATAAGMIPSSLLTLIPKFPTQAFLSSAANLYRANDRVFTLLQALDVPTVYT